MPAFAADTFVNTAATLLQNHSPTTVGSWAKHAGASANASIDSTGGRLQTDSNSSSANIAYWVTAAAGSANYTVACDVVRVAAGGGAPTAGHTGRAQAGTSNSLAAYEARRSHNSGSPAGSCGAS